LGCPVRFQALVFGLPGWRKAKELAFGPYPLIPLRAAREKRDDAKRTLLSGQYPGQIKQLRRRAEQIESRNTFSIIAQELVDKKRRESRAEQTLVKTKWLLSFVESHLVIGPFPRFRLRKF
jgi:hypothetical protein